MRLAAGGECGDLLVPDMDPVDLSLAAYGVRQAVEAIAYDAINPLDAGDRQRLGELICNRRHARLPFSRWTCACVRTADPSARSFLPRLFLDCAAGGAPTPPFGTGGRRPRSAIIGLILALVRAPVEPFVAGSTAVYDALARSVSTEMASLQWPR